MQTVNSIQIIIFIKMMFIQYDYRFFFGIPVRSFWIKIFHKPEFVPAGASIKKNYRMRLFEKFEKRYDQLLTRKRFALRVIIFAGLALALELVTILAGSAGFHFIEGLTWLNSTLNAAMIVSGNGPPFSVQSEAGKVFQIIFSVVGVVIFVMVISAILVPVFHRVLHSFHFDPENNKK